VHVKSESRPRAEPSRGPHLLDHPPREDRVGDGCADERDRREKKSPVHIRSVVGAADGNTATLAVVSSTELDRPDHPAAFFFVGGFEPAELAHFNVQNEFLEEHDDDGVLEVLGHGVGVWWKRHRRRDFLDLRDVTRDWLETLASVCFLASGAALGVRLTNWLETLAHVDEAAVGFIDTRFRVIPSLREDSPASDELRRALEITRKLRGRKHLHPAVKEAWRAAIDPTDEAFLSAFRGLECVRRLYGEGETAEEMKAAWEAMALDLGAATEPFCVLRGTAKAIRHSNRPDSRRETHTVNTARERRGELLTYSADLVRTRTERNLGVGLAGPSAGPQPAG
jgi:hypothetical protein